MLAVGAAAIVSAQNATSTVYKEVIHTISKCASTVEHCPYTTAPVLVTETIALYTTYCPESDVTSAPPSYPTAAPVGPETETLVSLITEIYTISKCADTVTDCPYTTAPVVSTSIYPCPPEGTPTVVIPPVVAPSGPASVPVVPVPAAPTAPAAPVLSTSYVTTCVPTTYVTVVTVTATPAGPAITQPAGVAAPSGTGVYTPPSTPSSYVPANGAAAMGVSGLLMAVGFAAALL